VVLLKKTFTTKKKRCKLTDDSKVRRSRRLVIEQCEQRTMFASVPFGAAPHDTAEFMLGRIAVTPVLLESNGQVDANRENWDAVQISDVLAKVDDSLQWWDSLLASKTSVHDLQFVIDPTFANTPAPTVYEPINRVSDDYSRWVQEFLTNQGFAGSSDLEDNMRDFNHSQRLKLNADWAFTIFVVNSKNDGDGTFATGGTFSRAFAFAGGLFSVVPSTRPVSTFTHETGHVFWARDEYSGGASYYSRRGYYDTQNVNAIDNNPDPDFIQSASIMAAGSTLQTAYDNLVSPPSTLAMIGWQDSDSDGIFDVLDVPLKLDGVGQFNSQTGKYSFKGFVNAATLPNKNSSGLQNDITINKVARIEYRFNGGNWQTVTVVNDYAKTLDLSISTGPRQQGTIEIRAVSSTPGIYSNLFVGSLAPKADATWKNGINGFVWADADSDGIWDAGERKLPNATVQLVDSNQQPITLQKRVEPDDQSVGVLESNGYIGVSLSAVGLEADGGLGVFVDAQATTGTKVFRPYSLFTQDFLPVWRGENHKLKVDFSIDTSYVSVDVIGGQSSSFGRLEVYNIDGQLLDRVTSHSLALGQATTLQIGLDQANIAYAIVKGTQGSAIKIDNFRYGPKTTAKTDVNGRYYFTSLPAGDYRVRVTPPSTDFTVTSPASGILAASVVPATPTKNINFGVHFDGSPWHNFLLPVDVNDTGTVTALDALLIINLLNERGIGPLDSSVSSPPFVDVTGDGLLTPLDALTVINYLNAQGGGGEGELSDDGSGSGNSDSGGGEGEALTGLPTIDSIPTPKVRGYSPEKRSAQQAFTADFSSSSRQHESCAHTIADTRATDSPLVKRPDRGNAAAITIPNRAALVNYVFGPRQSGYQQTDAAHPQKLSEDAFSDSSFLDLLIHD
jgi:Dockerin type I domain